MIMTQDEILKLKSAFLYILNKQQSIDILHLFKILYFADREHLAKYGRRIINDSFCAMPNGPVPSCLYDTIKLKNGTLEKPEYFDELKFKTILNSFKTGEDDAYYYLFPNESPDMDELSISDIECLERAIAQYKDFDFNEISILSHDSAWRKAWDRRRNSKINSLDIAEAGGANDDFLEYIKETEEFASCLQ